MLTAAQVALQLGMRIGRAPAAWNAGTAPCLPKFSAHTIKAPTQPSAG